MTSNSNLSTDLLSERYASALYTLSTEKKCVDQVLKDLNKIVEIFENNKNFSLLIKSPLILSEDKLKVINTILKKNESHKLTHNLMKIVSKNKRFFSLINIIKKINDINSEKRKEVIAEVTSAEELNNLDKNIIQKELTNKLGEKLKVDYIVNNKIIAGLIIKIGSKMIDSSLLTKINKLKLLMKET